MCFPAEHTKYTRKSEKLKRACQRIHHLRTDNIGPFLVIFAGKQKSGLSLPRCVFFFGSRYHVRWCWQASCLAVAADSVTATHPVPYRFRKPYFILTYSTERFVSVANLQSTATQSPPYRLRRIFFLTCLTFSFLSYLPAFAGLQVTDCHSISAVPITNYALVYFERRRASKLHGVFFSGTPFEIAA